MEEEGIGVHSLTHSILGVKGCARALGWRLRWVTRESINKMDMLKPNNKLVNMWLEYFWCPDESWAYIESQNSLRPKLGGNHHLPLYNILYD